MKKTKVVTKLIAIILSILVVVQVAPMSTFAETIETESEKFEESGYSTEVSQEEEDPIVIGEDVDRRDSSNTKYFKMSDGTIKAAVYKDPVLYQDSAGKWQEMIIHLKHQTMRMMSFQTLMDMQPKAISLG